MIDAIIQHLLISTTIATLVAGIVWMRKSDSAALRYRFWLVAALQFAVPMPMFTKLGVWVRQFVPARLVPLSVDRSGARVMGKLVEAWPQADGNIKWLTTGLAMVWLFGALLLLLVWMERMRSQRPPSDSAPADLVGMVSALSQRVGIRRKLTVRSVMNGYDLSLFGTLRPVMLVPRSLCESLRAEELEAVLVHELMHVRRRDNLAAVLVHVVVCIFWFHPALWWIERRLLVERELACDEAVIDWGWPAESYATGIVKLCRFHFEELQAGACGFSSSSLQERMERIMSYRPIRNSKLGQLILAALGVALPLTCATAGFVKAHSTDGQAQGQAQQQRAATCVFADKRYPEGAIIRQDGREQMCVLGLSDRPMWVRTSPEMRQRGQSVSEVPPLVPKLCTPKASTSKSSCVCEESDIYSPGSIVLSSRGRLSCTAGRWNDMPNGPKQSIPASLR